jgi:hypothetical protein
VSAYDDAIARRCELESESRVLQETYEAKEAAIDDAILATDKLIKAIEEGMAADDWQAARSIVAIEWDKKVTTGDVVQCFYDAVEFFRSPPPVGALRSVYYGVKSYDRWPSQREDHQYGFGPKHGSIWFRIGLVNGERDREYTEEERLACIRYLRAVMKSPSLV